MRIEIACPSRELYGSDRSAVRLGVVLRSLGADVWLSVPAARPELGLAELAREHGLETRPGPIVVASSRGLTGLARRRPAGPVADLTILNSAAVVAPATRGGRRLLVLREWLEPAMVRHRILCAWHARRVERVVAVSNPVAAGWRRCTSAELPIDVIANWIDDRGLPRPGPREGDGILFAGRLSSWKGQEVLADAFDRAFGATAPQPSLTFVGAEGPGSPFHPYAARLRARARTRAWKVLDRTADPGPLFDRAALVVVPSLRPEPFGNVILEGLARGCRVIAFPGGGVDDLAPRFPEALRVVERGVDPLAVALAEWWRQGARPQSEERWQATRETIAARFSEPAARRRWAHQLESLGP